MDSFNLKLERIGSAKEAIKTSLTNKGMSPSDNIEDYAQIIDSIESGSGDVKQFATIEEMQADTTAKEGDLAIVYRSEVQNAAVDSHFQTATFPDTVVLDTAITDYVEVRYRAVNSSVMFDCMGNLDSSMFMMDCYTESREIRIQYTSSDGITYTRTDTTGNPVDFGTEIYYEMTEMWNDAIGKFIQVGGMVFDGMYQYSSYIDKENLGFTNLTDITWDYLPSSPTGTTYYITNVAWNNTIRKIVSAKQLKEIAENILVDFPNSYIYFAFDENDTLVAWKSEKGSENYIVADLAYNTDKEYLGVGTPYNYADLKMRKFTLDLDNNTYTSSELLSIAGLLEDCSYFNFKVTTNTYQYDYIKKTISIGNNYIICGTTDTRSRVSYSGSGSPPISEEGIFETKYKYMPAPTQLSVTSDYVYEKEFYGKNGVESGKLTQSVSNSFADINAEIVYKIQNQYENMEPRILTDSSSSTLNPNIYFIPVKKDGTVLLDTSRVTKMDYMFGNCKNLTTIPLLNTSSVTKMRGMFSFCANLITIPLLDTSNVTGMYSMFLGCTNLTTIPLLDTSNVTDMRAMFYGCTNLTTIPLLNTSNVTDMKEMFLNCASLSDESLNNILAMCANATSYTSTKTLKYINLTSEQATKCTTLSNYSAFTAAGWTTGY